jgi:hypothetical protein
MDNDDIIPEEEEKIIEDAAIFFFERGLEFPAVFLLEFYKPFSFIGGSFAYFFLSQLYPITGEKVNKYLTIFSKKENIEKVIVSIEQKVKNRGALKKLNKQKKLLDKNP